jgi:uncharacterized protein
MKMSTMDTVAMVLVVIGALNWGLVGLLDLNVVESLGMTLAKIVYILVGLSGLYMLYAWYGKKK